MAVVVPFQPHHADGAIAVILSIQQTEFGIPISLDDQPDLLDVEAFYRDGGGEFWVALDGEDVVGTIALLDIGHGQAALRKMFVRASHRGAAHGVAQALLDTLIDTGRTRGIGEVWLGTTSRFLAAHRFYEKNGFTTVDPSALPARFPVMAIDSKFYRRRL